MEAVAIRDTTLRRLASTDLDAVVDIDAIAEGRMRRAYFERRLAAALREPAAYVQFAAVLDDHLAGYVLAHVLEGEFGRDVPAMSIEAIGARYDAKGAGVGRRHSRAANAGALERPRDAALAGRQRICGRCQSHRRLRDRRRRIRREP
jgi:hypothetical protein